MNDLHLLNADAPVVVVIPTIGDLLVTPEGWAVRQTDHHTVKTVTVPARYVHDNLPVIGRLWRVFDDWAVVILSDGTPTNWPAEWVRPIPA